VFWAGLQYDLLNPQLLDKYVGRGETDDGDGTLVDAVLLEQQRPIYQITQFHLGHGQVILPELPET
jgi:hypothetical protein